MSLPLLNQRCLLRGVEVGWLNPIYIAFNNALLHEALLAIIHGFRAVWLLLLVHAS